MGKTCKVYRQENTESAERENDIKQHFLLTVLS